MKSQSKKIKPRSITGAYCTAAAPQTRKADACIEFRWQKWKVLSFGTKTIVVCLEFIVPAYATPLLWAKNIACSRPVDEIFARDICGRMLKKTVTKICFLVTTIPTSTCLQLLVFSNIREYLATEFEIIIN